ncbi:3-hydroxyisobutyrate dehydrogenase-like beta-hydroxyacid dehydrogenase [Dyadobacter jejuensis]|uniref:3-hydroxyisobutyrate dehydrogenase-like beta-hydroxyacid dehydrogenase n=1 Tax=Dyadobacter jejuensis TaxID=1082580 RepID=A0A316A8Z8_9BACT|nr:NAD(P)-dependent oxidoreductase [Dyadobacter jejuensis]PWJ53909.1 3-hydroxyisobutyrate dehydrogenase-like beta-hydroxyacid dehydrogenase [Dyadobacter jejuensis]
MKENITLLGLGNLGMPIAEKLLEAGFPLKVWNRTMSKAEPLVNSGAVLAMSPEEAITPGGILITVLADDRVLKNVIFPDVLKRLGSGGLHISVSTISPETSRELYLQHKNLGSQYLAAPIFARPEAIRTKVGNICLSGDEDARIRARGIVAHFAKGIFDFGDEPGAANIVKLAGNFMIGASIEMMAEAFTFAEKNDISRQAIYEMLTQTLFSAPIFQNYGKMVADHNYKPVAFQLPLGLKDINLVLKTSEASSVPMPMADLIRNRFVSAIAKERTNLDWSALAIGASDEAGL